MWLDLLCFDVLHDLTFGESFDGVKTGKVDPYLDNIYMGCRMTPVVLMMWDYTIVKWALALMSQLPSIKNTQEGDKIVQDAKIAKRTALKDDARKDFMTYVCWIF